MPRVLLLTAVVLIAATMSLLLWRGLRARISGPRPDTAQPSPAAGLLLFLLPLPVAVAAAVSLAQGQLVPLLGNAVGYGLFLGGALLVRRGLLSAGRLTSGHLPFKTPWKIAGSMLISLATGITAWLGVGHHPAIAAAFALVALLGCHLTYGLDWRISRAARDLGEHARTTLVEADRSIAAIELASRNIRQTELSTRLGCIAELARDILNRLVEDPRDLHRARTFLNVYLDGVQRVVETYAKTHHRITAPELNDRLRRALITVEDVFRAQQQRLLESDLDDLDIQVDVLTQQLKREGIL